MSNRVPSTDELKEKIFRFLRVEHKFINPSNVFEKLVENKYINSHYDFCQIFSENRYINRHDKGHALKTTLFGLRIFGILENIESLKTWTSDFGFATLHPKLKFTLEETCTVIIISTYCHDIYKFFEEKHPEQAGLIIHNIREDVETIYPKNFDEFLPIIESCIFNHEGKRLATYAEEGIVILADGMDCTQNRLCGNFRPEEVIRHDKKPIEYFSCQEIKDAQILRGRERHVLVNFFVEGKAAWHQIHQFKERLKNTQLENFFQIDAYWRDFREPIRIWPE